MGRGRAVVVVIVSGGSLAFVSDGDVAGMHCCVVLSEGEGGWGG